MLGRLLRDALHGRSPPAATQAARADTPTQPDIHRVLNVGGFSKSIPIPPRYAGWDHVLLDIDPSVQPDVVCDARELRQLDPEQFDAVYCSHNLEHYYQHDGARVLAGMRHVLKADGFVEIRVPDMRSVLRKFIENDMDIHDTLYDANSGPISVHDVIYGWGKKIEESGVEFFAHKTGFTESSLRSALMSAGFSHVLTAADPKRYEIAALAFKRAPSGAQRELLGIDRILDAHP